MSEGRGDTRRGGRGVPALYGMVSAVLVAGALTFALSSPPPSTPPLAEVAPAPQENIEVERVEQSSQFGEGQSGEGDCEIGAGCEGVGEEQQQPVEAEPTPPPPTADSSVSQAHSWPCVMGEGGPRQTEDPQSPPCIGSRFEGDNGGATSMGVTRDKIRIAYPAGLGECWDANNGGDCSGDASVLGAFASHVNNHFELYGRALELVPVDEPEGSGPAEQRAFASELASVEPFAVLAWNGAGTPLYEELARSGIVALESGHDPVDRQRVHQRLHPYVWSVYPSAQAAVQATGELVCRSLAGQPARHGGQEVASRPRRFGVVQEAEEGQRPPISELVSRMEACGAPHVVRAFDPDVDDRDLLIASLKEDGVTTVLCVCHGRLTAYASAADAALYQPEWLLTGFFGLSDGDEITSLSRTQRGHVFGLVPGLREVTDTTPGAPTTIRLEEQFWYQVLREEYPEWQHRRTEQKQAWSAYNVYAQFLMLASGIQWAGPELSPETFASGLQGKTWPNPGVGAEPWFQPAVTFGPSDHTFNSDFALAWWRLPTEQEESSLREKGAYCYVGGGTRFTAGTVPSDADDRFFDPEAGCR